jgi:hypothetical protein
MLMKLDDSFQGYIFDLFLYTGEKWAVLQSDGTIPVVTDLLNNMVRIGVISTESSIKRVVYGDSSSHICEVERGRATGNHVTRNHVTESHVSCGQSHDRKRLCPEGYAHAQPEHVVSHVTDPDRKSRARKGTEVCSAHSRVFMATEGWKGVHNIRPSGAFYPEVRVSRAFFLSTEGWGDLYDVCVLYLVWLLELATRVLYLAWLPELALVIYPFPAILFSHNIYIMYVV